VTPDRPDFTVRQAGAADAGGCAAIYAPYVLETAISFEDVPPSAEELRERIAAAHVWLVAEHEGELLGYAYGARHQQRAAYRWSADVSVYLDPRHHRRGVGSALYRELFERLAAGGICMVCAGITTPNGASEALHARLGFVPVGVYRAIGWKLGRWHDVLWMQRDLRPGAAGGPPPAIVAFGRGA
jgi:phosphinothricin acetyltransferase